MRYDSRCYAVFCKKRPRERILVETLEEAFKAWHEKGGRESNWTIKRRHPKNCHETINNILKELGLEHCRAWYDPRNRYGWMINDGEGDYGAQRLGYNFRQAIEMLRGKAILALYGKHGETSHGQERGGSRTEADPDA